MGYDPKKRYVCPVCGKTCKPGKAWCSEACEKKDSKFLSGGNS